MPYRITEPHPTVLPNHYMHTGRGGAGNMYKASSKASSKASKASSSQLSKTPSHLSTQSPKASTGRGGAGNIHAHAELSLFSFADELALQSSLESRVNVAGRTWHVGRGGAGNQALGGLKPGMRQTRSDSQSSSGSGSETRSGFLGRLSGVFDRS